MGTHVVRYGSSEQELSIASDRFAGYLAIQGSGAGRPADAAELIARALRNPLGSPPLCELARGKRSAAILIPGKARRVGTQDFVPALIAELEAGGVPTDGIEVFLADGTHEQHLEDDIVELLGEETARRVRCLGHDCKDPEAVEELGTTSFGTPVRFNRRVLAADLRILTGRIVPHYFAGYSGGRKALLPGVAAFATIRANHRLTLDDSGGIRPGVAACSLRENAVHLDMLEAARMGRPDFCLNTVLDGDHRMLAVLAGDFEAAHAEGCRVADRTLKVPALAPLDGVIAVAGGLPYDSNFMQALKAPFNTLAAVRAGGAILWIAEAAGGMHPGFLEWARIESLAELRRAVCENYALTGHNSIMLRELVERFDVGLVSRLPPADVAQLRVRPFDSVAAGALWFSERIGASGSYAVAPHANVMCVSSRADTG